MAFSSQDRSQTVYTVAFAIIALSALVLLYLLVFLRSEADTSGQTATVTNAAPTVDSVTISTDSLGSAATSLNQTENTTRTIYIHGTFTDNNGCELADTVGNWTVVFYRTTATNGTSCTAAGASCYQPTESSVLAVTNCSGATDLTGTYQATLTDINYYADPTDGSGTHSGTNWTAYVSAVDDSGASGNSSTTTEMNTLTALDVTSSISYGSLALSGTSSQKTMVVTNIGNKAAMDVTVSADRVLTCTTGAMTAAANKFSTTTGFTFASGTNFAVSSNETIDLNLNAATSATASTTAVYTKLVLPASGISGTCTNTITVTGV